MFAFLVVELFFESLLEAAYIGVFEHLGEFGVAVQFAVVDFIYF